MKFRTKLALAQAFLDDCVTNIVYPRHFLRILRRNHVRVTKSSLRRHALNERDIERHQIEQLEWMSAKQSLELLTGEERKDFEFYVQQVINTQREKQQSVE